MKFGKSVRTLSIVIAFAGATLARADDTPAAASPAQQVARTPAKPDPAHPARLGTAYYPKESLRLHEEGMCVVKMIIQADGQTRDVAIVRSSGSPRLDDACVKAYYPGRFIPATENGVPIESPLVIPTVWQLPQ
jgi:protein TonB